ncbi:hypothetical protein EMPG_09587, partial [Blastomyces silverae]
HAYHCNQVAQLFACHSTIKRSGRLYVPHRKDLTALNKPGPTCPGRHTKAK